MKCVSKVAYTTHNNSEFDYKMNFLLTRLTTGGQTKAPGPHVDR